GDLSRRETSLCWLQGEGRMLELTSRRLESLAQKSRPAIFSESGSLGPTRSYCVWHWARSRPRRFRRACPSRLTVLDRERLWSWEDCSQASRLVRLLPLRPRLLEPRFLLMVRMWTASILRTRRRTRKRS